MIDMGARVQAKYLRNIEIQLLRLLRECVIIIIDVFLFIQVCADRYIHRYNVRIHKK